jgi:two-component system NtrC family sensor kinase
LAAGIAHEINNPLQVIMGNAELILDTEDLKERTKEKLADILQAAEQIREIAHSITHFADARRTEEKELLDFNKVVQEAAQLVSYSLVRDGIQVNLELSPVPPIWGRRGDLEEIVVQLVRNAGEAIAESCKGSKVIIRTGVQGNWARLEVEDDGPGVPVELRDRIFDPFVTTKATRGGTGLGLAIVQNLITAHNGRIWLEDSPLGGAKFVVELTLWQIGDKGENREEGE